MNNPEEDENNETPIVMVNSKPTKKSKKKNRVIDLFSKYKQHAAAVVVVVGIGLIGVHLMYPSHAAAPTSTSSSASTTFRVVGNQVISPSGQQFVPYGFVMDCLALIDYSSCTTPTTKHASPLIEQIDAAGTYWKANDMRLQVSDQNLFDNKNYGTGNYDTAYMALVDQAVAEANKNHMVATISLQTEEENGPPLPTQPAVNFWNVVASHYKNNRHVFFDLYNEPRLNQWAYGSYADIWNIWRNGGYVNSLTSTSCITKAYECLNETFVGMQTLVDNIHDLGAYNIIIAQTNFTETDPAGLPQYTLNGNNIAYGVKPVVALDYNDATGAASQTQWNQHWYATFGNLSSKLPIMPEEIDNVVNSTECSTISPVVMPWLLSYLHSKNLGLLDYTLEPGYATTDSTSYTTPTSYGTATTNTCTSAARTTNTVGDGQLLYDWFQKNSSTAF